MRKTQVKIDFRTLIEYGADFNKFSDEDAADIAKFITNVNGLRTWDELDLSHRRINSEGLKIILEALKDNQSIDRVNLSGMELKEQDALALAEMLKVNKTLLRIALEWNQIGDEGAKALAEALKVNNSLRYINLKGNPIKEEGIIALVESLKINNNIRMLELHDLDECVELKITPEFIKLINNNK